MRTGLHIGLIGGFSPFATIVYYRRLTEAVSARDGRLELTIVHAQAGEVAANLTADRRDVQAEIFAGLIDRLEAAGADCVALTSVGAHFCLKELRAVTSLPIVSSIELLDTALAAQGLNRVGLLGTAAAMRSRLFGQLRKTRAVVLDNEVTSLGQLNTEIAIAGICPPETRTVFIEAGRRLMERGAEAVVLAGNDLGIAFDSHDPGYPIIEALGVHVEALADLATGHRTLAQVN